MRTFNIIVFLLVLFIYRADAQLVSSRIYSSTTSLGVAFANVGVLHKNIGTVTDEAGNFSLDVTGLPVTDTLKVSCIGFQDYIITIAGFKALSGGIALSPKTTQLKPVIVRPLNLQQLQVGLNTQSQSVKGGFTSNDLGSELGTVFNYKGKKPGQLKQVSVSIAYSAYDTLLFRLNVYKMVKGRPAENILTEPIFIKTALKNGVLTTDLSSYNIEVNGPVLVSLEWVKELYGTDLFFSFRLFKRVSFARKTSHGDWYKLGHGAGIWGIIETEK